MDISFFKSTPLFKELVVLDLIEKQTNITQRELSDILGSSVAMTNNYINEYELRGLLRRKYKSRKEVEYLITDEGRERRKLLSIRYLNEVQKKYDAAKDEIINFVNELKEKGFKKIILYGAGEVAEIFLNAIKDQIKVLAIIDDDVNKQGKELVNVKIITLSEIENIKHNAILISSYGHQSKMERKLEAMNYPSEKILRLFQ